MEFAFATATRIVFGPGSIDTLAAAAPTLGARALLVTGASPERAEPAARALEAAGVAARRHPVAGEPTVEDLQGGLVAAREHGADVVVAMGGGSAIDTGKAIAALLPAPGPLLRYLEVIGEARPLEAAPLPFVAVPTTAGTGAEVTKNAVLASPEHGVKVSLRDERMLPDLAIVDPELTAGMPPSVTASTGLDALTQVIEPFVSHRANPLTDALCRDAIARGARALPRAHADGADTGARQDMALVSLFGGLALANAGLGAVHGFAGPLGGAIGAPHGVICGRLLPFVVETNVAALSRRDPEHPALARYAEVARLLTGDPGASVDDGVAWLADLGRTLDVPGLGAYGLEEADTASHVAAAQRASSMRGNPVELTDGELADLLRRAA